jgi:hypothetical protein
MKQILDFKQQPKNVLTDYIEYAEGKIDIGELPLAFPDWAGIEFDEDSPISKSIATPTSKEGLEDSEIRVYGIDSNLHDGKIFDLTNNDFVHIAEEQGYVWTLAGFESAFNSEEIAYDMFIRFINPVKEQL